MTNISLRQDDETREDGAPVSMTPDTVSTASSKGSLLVDHATVITSATITPNFSTPTTIMSTTTSYTTTSSSTGSSPPSAKNARKLGALRTHSPTGQSPQTKARKSTGPSTFNGEALLSLTFSLF